MNKSVTVVGLLIIWMTLPKVGEAGGDSEARAAFSEGVDAFEAGNIEDALRAFETAYALRPSYKILFNIAQAQAELNETERAIQTFEKYLEDGGNEISEGRRLKVEEEIKRLRIKAGELPAPTPPSPETPEAGPVVAASVEPVPQKSFLWNVAPWVSAGIAAVTLTTGIIVGSKAASLNKKLGNNCTDNRCSPSYGEDIDAMQHLAVAADVMFIATTLFSAATISLLVVKRQRGKKEEK